MVKTCIYTILVIDLNTAYCAEIYTNGEIKTLFDLHSTVPHKMKPGGQSALRFSRIRENEIVAWFKRLDGHIDKIGNNFYLLISPIYSKRFINYLKTYNKNKIKEIRNTEYTGINGIYQFINKIENEKRKKKKTIN